jgi:hypothetical protein
VATFLVRAEYSDEYIARFDELRQNDSEIQRLKWISVDAIYDAIDTYEIQGANMTWGEYNSASNLKDLFEPLNGLYSGSELELEKNKLKRNLPVVADDGELIFIADYVARTFMENRSDFK